MVAFVIDNGMHGEQIAHALEVPSNRNIRNIMSREACKTAAESGWDASRGKYLEFYGQILETKHAMLEQWKWRQETPDMAPTSHPVHSLTWTDQMDHKIR